MQFQITELELDFRPNYFGRGYEGVLSQDEQSEVIDELVNYIWEADNEDDFIEEVKCVAGWKIKSIDFRHVLN